MTPAYHLGYRPEMEMLVRNFLSSVFYKEVAFGQERRWLETLLLQVSPMRDIPTMSRMLLFISSLAKEEDWQFGVQRADHLEAIPATLSVASARYRTLVTFLNTIRQGQLGFMIPPILQSYLEGLG
jgi:hypothetical protein